MIDLELKRKRIETLAKIGALVVTCLVLGPFYLTLLHGLGALFALFIAFGIGFVAINFMPWFAAMVANWRLKALKYEASVNPIETLENQEADKMKALAARREEIKELLVVVQDLWGQILRDTISCGPWWPTGVKSSNKPNKALRNFTTLLRRNARIGGSLKPLPKLKNWRMPVKIFRLIL